MKRGAALPLLVALAALPAALAHREAQSAPCQASVDEARRHLDRGVSLYDKRQYAEAGAEFDAAYLAQSFSAFRFNAARAYEAAADLPAAIARYEAFLAAEPNPPDLPAIKKSLASLRTRQAELSASADAGAGDAGAPEPGVPPPLALEARSQLLVISDPPDAPLHVYLRRPGAAPFSPTGPNPGWDKAVAAARTPHDLSLGPGDYHVVIDAFKDYKRVETDFSLAAGQLYELKAVLSQGVFMGFLRVLSPAPGARLYLDDPPPHRKPPWGRAPHGALLESGPHQIWVEAPGYEPATEKVVIEHGKTREVTPTLERVHYGYLRLDGNADEVTIRIDGARRGVYVPIGEPLRVRLDAGPHRVELEAPGRKTWAGDVEVPRGQELPVHGRLAYRPARSTTVVSGALAVGAVIGGVALFKTAAAQQDATTTPGGSTSGAATWLRVGGVTSFGVGALLTATTIYALAVDASPPSTIRLEKPRELDEPDMDAGGYVPGLRGRVVGNEARAEPRCGAL